MCVLYMYVAYSYSVIFLFLCYVLSCFVFVLFFFFFKQKTAYEMRISDWSSDVCSSDLDHGVPAPVCLAGAGDAAAGREHGGPVADGAGMADLGAGAPLLRHAVSAGRHGRARASPGADRGAAGAGRDGRDAGAGRSEEHTSELQSLMRI